MPTIEPIFIPNLPLPYCTLAEVGSGIPVNCSGIKWENAYAALHWIRPSVHSNFEHKRLQGNSVSAMAVWLYSE